MSDHLNELLDHHRIRQTLERYTRGIDRLDSELIDSVYWEDSTDDHGLYSGPGPDFSAFIIPLLRENYACTMHLLGQSNLEIIGDRAAGDTYFIAYHTRRDGDGLAIDIAGGRYADRLERRNGVWKIKDRIVVMDWTETRQGLENAAIALAKFTNGRRDTSDSGYASYQWVRQRNG